MPKRFLCVLAVASMAATGAVVTVTPAWAATTAVTVGAPDSPNLAGQGQLALTMFSTNKFDAAKVDPESVTVAGSTIGVTRIGITRWVEGQPMSVVTDVNSDGRADLRLFFDKQALRDNGILTAASTELTLSSRRPDGQLVTGSHAVKPVLVLEVKFSEALAVRGSGRALHSDRGADLTAVQALLQRHGAVELDPLLPAQTLTALPAATGVPDMASWYQLTLPAAANVDKVLADLMASPAVAYAYPAPEAAPPPATPDFTSMQGYQRPAPQGVDADFSRADSRSRGTGMRIVDLEYDWNPFHEDLGLTWSSDLGGTQFPRTTYRPAASLSFLSTILTRGDTVLIEQQTVGPNGGTRYVPLEWIQSVFDAFVVLNNMGVVVVETGANGGENLDSSAFQGKFNRSVRDSGAIIVGAGSSTSPHTRLSFSSYGSRVDVQGWGQNITTTGSNGNLFGGTDPANINIRYTRSFGGTSGAGPIVTGVVVALQSKLRATGRPFLTASQMSSLLKSTGTPQGGDTSQRIGPLPNLRAALTALG